MAHASPLSRLNLGGLGDKLKDTVNLGKLKDTAKAHKHWLEGMVAWLSAVLAIAGVATFYHFTIAAKKSTEAIAVAFGVDSGKANLDNPFRTAALVTLIVICCLAGAAMLLACVRVHLGNSSHDGSYSRTLSWFYLYNVYPVYYLICAATIWMVLLLIAGILWFALVWMMDIGVNFLISSSIGTQWKEMQTNSAALSALPTRWNNVKSSASPVVVSALDPGITALDRVLSATSSGQGSCGQFCFDLSDGLLGSLVSSTNPNRCLCDFSRFTASRAAARRAWQSEVPYVLLGVGLAYLGLFALALDCSAHIARTHSERGLVPHDSDDEDTFIASNKVAVVESSAEERQQGAQQAAPAATAVTVAGGGGGGGAYVASTQPLEQAWATSQPYTNGFGAQQAFPGAGGAVAYGGYPQQSYQQGFPAQAGFPAQPNVFYG